MADLGGRRTADDLLSACYLDTQTPRAQGPTEPLLPPLLHTDLPPGLTRDDTWGACATCRAAAYDARVTLEAGPLVPGHILADF